MRKNKDGLFIVFIFSAIGSLFLSSCKMGHEQTAGPDLNGASIAADQFGVALTSPSASLFSYKVSIDGTHVDDCLASPGEDINCIVDMYELDLFFNGYALYDHMPSSQCVYRSFRPYFYQVAPMGRPPDYLDYAVDGDGVIQSCSFSFPDGAAPSLAVNGLVMGANCAFTYYIPALSGGALQTATYTPVVEDDIRCPFDYRKDSVYTRGKNCCYGTYTKRADNDGDVTTTEDVTWDGQGTNCFRGPGTTDSSILSGEMKLPQTTYTYVPTSGLSNEYVVKQPLTVDSDYGYPNEEILFASNYYKTASWSHASFNNYNNMPPGLGSIYANPYFVYECLDSAFDVISRITVQVRKWNVLGGITTPTTSAAADTQADSGESTCEDAPFGTYPKNDRFDWDAVGQIADMGYLGFSGNNDVELVCP